MMNSVWRPVPLGSDFVQPKRPPISAKGFINKILNDLSLGFGSLLAYSFVIALLPLAVAALGILGFVFEGNSSAQQSLVNSVVNSIQDNTTRSAAQQIATIAANNLASGAGGIFAIGFVTAIWGGSRLFVAIDNVLTIIYRTTDRSFLRQNLLAIGMLFLFILFIIIIIGASAVPSFLINTIAGEDGAQFGIFVAGIFTSIGIGFILFLLIYLIVPNKKMKFTKTWCGALIASILLDIFLILFPLYIRRFMTSFIGLIGFAVILITFFYYFSIIIILGAQVNAYFFERIQPLPESLGTFISQSVGKLRGTAPVPVNRYSQYPRPRLTQRYY